MQFDVWDSVHLAESVTAGCYTLSHCGDRENRQGLKKTYKNRLVRGYSDRKGSCAGL